VHFLIIKKEVKVGGLLKENLLKKKVVKILEGLFMIFKELLEHIISTEERAGRIYESIAKISDGDIEITALNFARQEQHHKEIINQFINEGKTLDQIVPENATLLLESYENNQREALIKDVSASRKELFRFALQMEKDSITLYEEIIRLFHLEDFSKQYFEKLVKEERGHMYYVLKQLHELK